MYPSQWTTDSPLESELVQSLSKPEFEAELAKAALVRRASEVSSSSQHLERRTPMAVRRVVLSTVLIIAMFANTAYLFAAYYQLEQSANSPVAPAVETTLGTDSLTAFGAMGATLVGEQ